MRKIMQTTLTKWLIALGALLLCGSVSAQYPTKPIKIVVPFPAGTASDTVARILATSMSSSMGQAVIVENRPGADSAIGAASVAAAPPDGYTLLLATNGFAALPAMRKSLPYDAMKDFTPVSFVSRFALFLYANSDLPVKSLPELLSYAKANPGKLNYATGNPTGIVATAQLMSMSGINLLHIPYKGEPAGMTDLVANRVQIMFATPGSANNFVKDGRLRMLATTLPARAPVAPDVPSMVEFFPKFSVVAWAALLAPSGTPAEIVNRLSREVIAAINRPDVKAQMDSRQYFGHGSTPEELGTYLREQFDVYARSLRAAGVQPE
jgi:tripartite-type tricarboxylate transporter receptor subunit TctC